MNPSDYAQTGTEHSHQVALFMWCALNVGNYPELHLLFAIPNGGLRNRATAGRLKAEGVKAGVSDLMLPVARCGYRGIFLEMKKPGEKIKPGSSQEKWGEAVKAQGYYFAECDNWEKAANLLVTYLKS